MNKNFLILVLSIYTSMHGAMNELKEENQELEMQPMGLAPAQLPHFVHPINYAPLGIKDPENLAAAMYRVVPDKKNKYLQSFLDSKVTGEGLQAIEDACQNGDVQEVEKWLQVAERHSYSFKRDSRSCSKRSMGAVGGFLVFALPASIATYLNAATQCTP